MTHPKLTSLSIVSILCLVAVAPALTFASAPAAANHGDDPGSYVATQGDNCVPIAVIGEGDQTVSEFYEYHPNSSGQYSSHGTAEYQQSQVSQFFVYHGEEGMSLVFLHDEYGDGNGGGAVSMGISGLPESGSWAVEDDHYGSSTDDNWQHSGTSSTVDWMWSDSRNDGGAFRGLSELGDGAIVVSANFGENSYAYQENDWAWATNETDWRVRTGGDPGNLAALDKSQDVTIERGTCSGGDVTGDLTASPTDPATGESVTLDASGSTGDVAAYHWDVDGDDSVEETTTEATTTATYDSTGTVEPTVFVESSSGENVTASTTLTVGDGSQPDATATASATTVTPGETVEFDGTGSSDNGEITSYEWSFGDGETASDATTTHAYAEGGTYEATLTVTDDAGNEGTDTVTVEVDEPPTAALDVPETTPAGETVTFDASGSSDDNGIAEYQWAVDGSSVDADDPSLEHAFSEAGDHTVSVTVVDGSDQTNSTTMTVAVTEDSAPSADVTVDSTTVAPGETVEFDGSDSSDEDGEITSYDWTFGDGNGSEGETTTHAYATEGAYEVTLNVTDDGGNHATDSETITVMADTDESASPEADLTAPSTVTADETVTFDASGSSDDNGIAEYQWEVDGSSVDADGATLDRTFSDTGDHTVTVTVVDGENQTHSDTTTVTIEADEESGDDGSDGSNGSDGSDGSGDSDDSNDSGDSDSSDDSNDSDNSDDTENSNDSDDSDDSNSGSPSSGSPSSGGSSGSSGGAVPPADDSASASVSEGDNGTLVVTVEDAAEGESVSADVPDAENETGLRSVELVPATDADELNVTLTPRDDVSAPTGTDAGLYELRTENATDVANVTYQVAVDTADVGESGEIQVLASDGSGVSRVNHTVVENGSTTVLEATTDDVDRFVVASVAPDVSASSIAADGAATTDGPVTIEATLANDGHADANQSVDLAVDGTVVDSKNVTVPAGGEANVTFETTFDEPGDARLSVAGTEQTVSVSGPNETVDGDQSTATEDAEGASTGTEVTDTGSTNRQNTGLAVAGLGVLVIGAAALIRVL